MTKTYGYDVYYRLKTPSSVLIAAHNKTEARELFQEWWEQASKEEIIDRFLAALKYEPEAEITYIDRVDALSEEDL